ncbi:MAG: DUF5663 domain-containing protein [Candidatus Paceibacteria bacterium]
MPQSVSNQTNLIKMLGLQELPDKEKLRVLDQVAYILNMRILERIPQALTEAQQTEVEQKLEEEEPQAVFDYLKNHVDGLDDIIEEEVKQIRKELFSRKEEARERAQEEVEQLEKQEM